MLEGPRKVLGQDGQQVSVQHSSNYVSVHPCWLPLARNAYNNLKLNAEQKSSKPSKIRDKHNSHIISELESDEEIMQQNKNSSNNSAIENHQKETIQQNINRIPKNSLKYIIRETNSFIPRIRTTKTTYFERKCQSTISI